MASTRVWRRFAGISAGCAAHVMRSRSTGACQGEVSPPKKVGFAGWVVADMDGTLVGQPGFKEGKYRTPTLAESPCFEPVCRWLRSGGGLLLVTSDDGNGPFRRIVKHIPAELRHRVLLSTSDGAALFTLGTDGEPTLVEGYGHGLRLPADSTYLDEVYEVAKAIYISFFQALAADPQALETFDDNHKSAYSRLIDRVQRGEVTYEEALAAENLIKPAGVRHRATMLWRTQAGPWSLWSKHGEGTEWEQLCSRHLVAPFTSIVLLGFPKRFSEPHVLSVQQQLDRLGLVASRAPNSVWLKRPGANKGVPVRWLEEQELGFCIRDAVALGDNPCGNDGPLAEFQGHGMPFISVGNDSKWQGLQTGGLEHGSAAVIEQLATALEQEAERARNEQRAPHSFRSLGIDAAVVANIAQSVVQGLADGKQTPAASL